MTIIIEVTDEAKKIHEESVIVDGCTFFCEGYNDNLKMGGLTVLNTTVPHPPDDTGTAIKRIADYYHVIKNDPKLQLIETVDDIFEAKKKDNIGIIIAAQNVNHFAHYYLDGMIELFYRLGNRMAILAYNERTFAADGCVEESNSGLSGEGRELIKEMNRVGMVIDLTHTGERSTLEAIDLSEKPCVFTHSNPKSISNVKRNITDEQIKKVAEKGGVIGLSPFPPLNWTGSDQIPTLEDFLNSISYVVDMVGIDHVGIGTDFEATPGAYPREVIIRELSLKSFSISIGDYWNNFPGNPDMMTLKGFHTMAEFPNLVQGLLNRGFDRESIQKILGLNFIRVFKEVWK